MSHSLSVGTVFSAAVSDVALPNDFGVARHEGLVIFIPFALPGDVVTARLTGMEKSFGFADVVAIDAPSPDRVTPFCSHFGDCGGCSLQHFRYERQLELKRNHIVEALKRLGGLNPDAVERTVPSPKTTDYRSKIELVFAREGGRTILGLKPRIRRGLGRGVPVVPLQECPVFSPETSRLISLINQLATESHLSVYEPQESRGLLKHLVIRQAKSTGQLMIIIETNGDAHEDVHPLWARLIEAMPGITSVYTATAAGPSNHRYFGNTTAVCGSDSLTEVLGNLAFAVLPQSFFQPNPAAAAMLYEALLKEAALTGRESVLGLFSGIGCIELYLAPFARSVVGVDSVEQNIESARRNALRNGLSNCTFVHARAEAALSSLRRQSFGRVVVDPPRSGLGAKIVDQICRIAAPMVLYVSCNPGTLARDLSLFRKGGYSIARLIPFDFFPHTGHVESLVSLTKRG